MHLLLRRRALRSIGRGYDLTQNHPLEAGYRERGNDGKRKED